MKNNTVGNKMKMDALTSEVAAIEKKAAALVVDMVGSVASRGTKEQIMSEVKSMLVDFPAEMREEILLNVIATLAISYSGLAPQSSNSKKTDVTRKKNKKPGFRLYDHQDDSDYLL